MAGASSAGTVTCASSLPKEVYNPKAVIPHAASLHQACAHCAIFPTAASRRSLGRVSVPVWPITLSGRLPVVALVGHYPTNKLIGRGPIPNRKSFPHPTMKRGVISSIRPSFPGLSQSLGQITHVLLTRSPLEYPRRGLSVRLACVKHAASVRPEPGSNSPTKNVKQTHPKEARDFNTSQKAKPDQIQKTDKDSIINITKTNSCPSQHPPCHKTKIMWHKNIYLHTIEFSKNTHPPAPTHTLADRTPVNLNICRPFRANSSSLAPPRSAVQIGVSAATGPTNTTTRISRPGEEVEGSLSFAA